MSKKIETVKDLVTALLKYEPNASIRYLTSGAQGFCIGLQHHDTCVYIGNEENKDINLVNNKDAQVLAKEGKKIFHRSR